MHPTSRTVANIQVERVIVLINTLDFPRDCWKS